ncbi:MAG TPA: sigma-70 family RNA polymerase sigma factor [Caulobacteraceae bacterium]|nr:sigma-70 family RNA polymerase sigma factor [Caulobacteraceae bacterium]
MAEVVTLPLRQIGLAEPHLKDLMIRGLDGDRAAYGDVLSGLMQLLRPYFAQRLRGSPQDVEDLVQETLMAIHAKRETYRRTELLTPWVFAIARYKLFNHFRRARHRMTLPIEDAMGLDDPANPEEGAIRHDVRRMLSFLPGRQRRLIEKVKLAGHSIEEAASEEGMSTGAAKVSLHRSMKSLSARTQDED